MRDTIFRNLPVFISRGRPQCIFCQLECLLCLLLDRIFVPARNRISIGNEPSDHVQALLHLACLRSHDSFPRRECCQPLARPGADNHRSSVNGILRHRQPGHFVVLDFPQLIGL